VSPGTIETPGLNKATGGARAEQVMQFLVSRIPLGRIGTPDDVADAVLFLASDQSRFVTGTELFVDGGTVQVCRRPSAPPAESGVTSRGPARCRRW
jgi:NAD(P)-dependent dehydrogenase (short-subunit alcohol dehydrogenase family)